MTTPLNKSEPEVKPWWISVKDKMPNRNDIVIGYSPELDNEGFHSYHFMRYENDKWIYYDDGSDVDIEITHWFDPCVLEFEKPASSSEAPTVKEEEDWKCGKCGNLNGSLNSICDHPDPVTGYCDGEKEITSSPDCESSVIKPCPFCGHDAETTNLHGPTFVSCGGDCPLNEICLRLEFWNTRSPMGFKGESKDNSQSYPKSVSACSSEATKEENKGKLMCPVCNDQIYFHKNEVMFCVTCYRNHRDGLESALAIANKKITELKEMHKERPDKYTIARIERLSNDLEVANHKIEELTKENEVLKEKAWKYDELCK